MKINELVNKINKKIQKQSEKWDNEGFQVKIQSTRNVNKPIVTLELSNLIIKKAIKNKTNFILTHHPLYLDKTKINKNIKKKIEKLKKHKINVYTVHTSADKFKKYNLSYFIGKSLELKTLNYNTFDKFGCSFQANNLKIKKLIKKLPKNSRYFISNENKINKIAIIAGSGKEYFQKALELNYDLLITSDISHHFAFDMIEANFNFIDIPHTCENVFLEFIKNLKIYDDFEYIDAKLVFKNNKERIIKWI